MTILYAEKMRKFVTESGTTLATPSRSAVTGLAGVTDRNVKNWICRIEVLTELLNVVMTSLTNYIYSTDDEIKNGRFHINT